MSEIKLCKCGCGQPTLRIYHGSKRTGPFADYIHGHQGRVNGTCNSGRKRTTAQKLFARLKRLAMVVTFQKPPLTHSEKVKAGWTPEARARLGATIRKLSKTPEYRAAHSAGLKRAWRRGVYDHVDMASHARATRQKVRTREKRSLINLVGQRFGKLVVIEFAGSNKWHEARWKCLCDCGKQTIVLSSHLRSTNTRSCGCARLKTPTPKKVADSINPTSPPTYLLNRNLSSKQSLARFLSELWAE